jgi:cytochrome c5
MKPWVVLVLLFFAFPAQAEMSDSDYKTDAGSLSAEESEAVRRRLSDQIAAERAREEEAKRAAKAEAERIETEREARPLGAKLVEARCLTCHNAGQMQRAAFGTPGWTATVLRMEWLNGARLEPGERAVIIGYLAARNPDHNAREWIFVFAASMVVAMMALAAWAFRRKRSSARQTG